MIEDIVDVLNKEWFRPSRIVQDRAAYEIVRLRNSLSSINELHHISQTESSYGEPLCEACGYIWPCPTNLLIPPLTVQEALDILGPIHK